MVEQPDGISAYIASGRQKSFEHPLFLRWRGVLIVWCDLLKQRAFGNAVYLSSHVDLLFTTPGKRFCDRL
jgi:hypothetical protein